MPLFSCAPLLGKTGSLSTRGGEVHIPLAARTSASHHIAVSGVREICKNPAAGGVSHLSPYRDEENQVFAVLSRLLLTAAVGTSGRPKMSLEVKIEEGLLGIGRLEDHVTTLAAITAVGPAPRHEFLTSEAHTSITAIAAPNVNFDLIDKAHA